MELRLMRYVIAIADAGSFRAAAQQLHMAQPPLSRQIADVERALGVRLFERRPTKLTAAGRVFVESARRVLAEADLAVARTKQVARGQTGIVRAGYGPTIAHDVIPTLLDRMHSRHPDIRVEANEMWDNEIVAGLSGGEIDVALGRHLPVPDEFTAETLRREPYEIVLGRQHRLADREAVALQELRGETFRCFPRRLAPRYYDAIMAALHASGETFPLWENPVPGLRNYLSLRSHGFMLLPCSLAGQLPAGIVSLRVLDALPMAELQLLWRRRDASAAVSSLVTLAISLNHVATGQESRSAHR